MLFVDRPFEWKSIHLDSYIRDFNAVSDEQNWKLIQSLLFKSIGVEGNPFLDWFFPQVAQKQVIQRQCNKA